MVKDHRPKIANTSVLSKFQIRGEKKANSKAHIWSLKEKKTWAAGLLQITSLPSQDRGQAEYTPPYPYPTCGIYTGYVVVVVVD